MNQLRGMGVTALSVMIAAVVSGLRLKPYMNAGETYTPPTFALYPALIAIAITVPVVFLLRRWQGKKAVAIGPVSFPGNLPFITLGCLLYVLIGVTFFPYQEPLQDNLPSQQPSSEESVPPDHSIGISLPLFGQNVPVYPERRAMRL